MNLAKQLRQEGIQQGIQQGIHQGEILILTRLLQRKFPEISAAHLARLAQASEAQLLRWNDRFIDAKSLDDIFKD